MIMKGYLAPDVILRMLINKDAASEEMLVRAENNEVELLTSVFALFEAVGSLEGTDDVDIGMLKRILKTVKISSEMEEDLKMGYDSFGEKRKNHLRSIALK